MSCSTSSSSSGRAAALALGLLAAACAGPRATAPAAPLPGKRVAVFPPADVATAGSAATRALLEPLEAALARRGLQVVGGEPVRAFMQRHRIRDPSLIDPDIAEAAHEELGVDGVLLTALEAYQAALPATFAMTMRLVTAANPPQLAWIEGVALNGEDSPGLFGLGRVTDVRVLQARALERLSGALARFLDGAGPAASRCPDGSTYRPRSAYRADALDGPEPRTVAVLPFQLAGGGRGAGELLALAFLRQLAVEPRMRPIEPGRVREVLMRYRLVMKGGLSLDQARLVLADIDADLLLTGTVTEYAEGGREGSPRVAFTAILLDRDKQEIVWESRSANTGSDGVWFFDAGRVRGAGELACRMVRNVARAIGEPAGRDG